MGRALSLLQDLQVINAPELAPAINGLLSDVDPATQASISTAVVVGAYGVAHKILDRHINPGDTASPASP